MNSAPIVGQIFGMLWWIIPFALAVSILKTPWFKGLLGEAIVRGSAKINLPADTYHAIHNVTLPTPDGTTQIDHIFVSCFGIFVVETKNMKGWIFGGENQSQWTQKIYKKTYKFQNPLRQNYKHVKALESALGLPLQILHSVVVFTGESEFKSVMPANVIRGGYTSYITSFQEPVLTEAEIQRVLSLIQSGRLKKSWKTNRQHLENLSHRSNGAINRTCPRCGASMFLRTAKSGTNVGKQFWGCSSFPKCRNVQNVT